MHLYEDEHENIQDAIDHYYQLGIDFMVHGNGYSEYHLALEK